MLMVSTLRQCWRNMKCFSKGNAYSEIYRFAFVSFISIYAAMLSDIILIGGQPTLLLFGICLGIMARPAALQEKEVGSGKADMSTIANSRFLQRGS